MNLVKTYFRQFAPPKPVPQKIPACAGMTEAHFQTACGDVRLCRAPACKTKPAPEAV
ncbi:hypothetical protein [Kingella potus]|uniref:hypothetical protein n=1 Tax=Kingella potus TaxID=265175 RepID=UPI001559258A|nr:hypothetical protein [Kingella potus]UOP01783.1 hypothetical protein LVJ84_06675 [Kingella potus]